MGVSVLVVVGAIVMVRGVSWDPAIEKLLEVPLCARLEFHRRKATRGMWDECGYDTLDDPGFLDGLFQVHRDVDYVVSARGAQRYRLAEWMSSHRSPVSAVVTLRGDRNRSHPDMIGLDG